MKINSTGRSKMWKSCVLFLCIFLTSILGEDNGCVINPFEIALHPLIILPKTTDFIYPRWGEKVLKFNRGDLMDVACPGRHIVLGSSQIPSSLVIASCVSGTIFKINDTEVDWNKLRCNGHPWRTIRYTGNICGKIGREIETGFILADDRFVRTFLICFNQAQEIAYYTYLNLTASINQRALNNARPAWLQGSESYTVGKVTNLYLRSRQKSIVNRLLGLPDKSTKYIQDTTNYFLAKGHLTPRSDLFYAAQQNATFFVQNAAPQWQTFNGFNWRRVETDVRDYAETNGVNLQIWTGVHGILTLPHEETGEDIELYLFVNNTSKKLPVPAIFWKAVFDPITEKGIALIGINNPYISTFKPICKDVSDNISWFHWKRCNQKMGLSYACSIPSFRKVVTVLPYFNVKGLLT